MRKSWTGTGRGRRLFLKQSNLYKALNRDSDKAATFGDGAELSFLPERVVYVPFLPGRKIASHFVNPKRCSENATNFCFKY